jgi:hypothetical protein
LDRNLSPLAQQARPGFGRASPGPGRAGPGRPVWPSLGRATNWPKAIQFHMRQDKTRGTQPVDRGHWGRRCEAATTTRGGHCMSALANGNLACGAEPTVHKNQQADDDMLLCATCRIDRSPPPQHLLHSPTHPHTTLHQ